MAFTELLVKSGSLVNLDFSCHAGKNQPNRAKGDQRTYPVRTCLGCGTKLKKAELVRFVLSAGHLTIDIMQVLSGRGVYCCRNVQCFQRLVKQRKKLAWALRCHETERAGGLVIRQGLDAEFVINL